MDDEREQQIRERAYHLWEEAGRPEGREHEFWELARQTHAAGSSSSTQEESINEVDEASEESFPASDPPSFTPGATGGPR